MNILRKRNIAPDIWKLAGTVSKALVLLKTGLVLPTRLGCCVEQKQIHNTLASYKAILTMVDRVKNKTTP